MNVGEKVIIHAPGQVSADVAKQWRKQLRVMGKPGIAKDTAIVEVEGGIEPPHEVLIGSADRTPFNYNFGGTIKRLPDVDGKLRYEVTVNVD